MKVAPVSADLLIKLAIAAAVAGAIVYMARAARAAVAGGVDRAADAVIEAGGRAADTVANATSDAVSAVGAAVGLPTPSQTIDDAAQVRYIIDASGYLAASQWATAGALFRGWALTAGSGTIPPINSPAALALGYYNTGGATGSW